MKKAVRVTALALAATAAVGAVAVFAAQGDQSDPLITLSYLNEVVAPKMEAAVKKAVDENAAELTRQLDIAITSYETRVDERLAAAGAVYTAKTLAQGEALTLPAGRELLLVSGAARSVGSLVDTTAGTTLASGVTLTAGHLYVTVSEGAGLEATAAVSAMTR